MIYKTSEPTILQRVLTGNHTIDRTDCDYEFYLPAPGSGVAITIPAEASVNLPIGFTFFVVNGATNSATVNISITSDTLTYSPSAATGNRSLGPAGSAFVTKVASTKWIVTGVGLT